VKLQINYVLYISQIFKETKQKKKRESREEEKFEQKREEKAACQPTVTLLAHHKSSSGAAGARVSRNILLPSGAGQGLKISPHDQTAYPNQH
jgi:hypothetical protein